MTPKQINQTSFGTVGNCLSACLASLLGIEIEDVPVFPKTGSTDKERWNNLRNWLETKNLGIINFSIKLEELRRQKGFMIISGKAARGFTHATIWRDGELWFDPHPDRTGLSDIRTAIYYTL